MQRGVQGLRFRGSEVESLGVGGFGDLGFGDFKFRIITLA